MCRLTLMLVTTCRPEMGLASKISRRRAGREAPHRGRKKRSTGPSAGPDAREVLGFLPEAGTKR